MTCHAVKTYKLFFSKYWISLYPYNVRTFTSVTRDTVASTTSESDAKVERGPAPRGES